MSIYLIDNRDSYKIKGKYEPLVEFSIANHSIVKIFEDVSITSDSVLDLIDAKRDAYAALHPQYSNVIHEEYISPYVSGPGISAASPPDAHRFDGSDGRLGYMFIGGQIDTNDLGIPSISAYRIRWHAYRFEFKTENAVLPNPIQNLYDYNPLTTTFEEVPPADMTFELRTAGGGGVIELATYDTDMTPAYGGDIRFRMINPVARCNISSWTLLYNT